MAFIIDDIINGIFNTANTHNTNNSNMRIAQLNNKFNERMLDKQMQYNTEMYERQLGDTRVLRDENISLNSPAAQRKRLEDAGLNPYMMMSGGGASFGGSSSSAPSAMGIDPPRASEVNRSVQNHPWSISADGIRTLLEIQAQKGVRSAQENLLNAQTKTEDDSRNDKIKNIQADTWDKLSHKDLNTIQTMYAGEQWLQFSAQRASNELRAMYEADNARYTGILIQAQTVYQQMQGALSYKQLRVFDVQFQQQMAVMASQQYANVKAGLCSEAQAKQAIANSCKIYAEKEGIELENFKASQIGSSLINIAKHNERKAYWDAEQSKLGKTSLEKTIRQQGADYWNPFRYTGTSLGDILRLGL